MVLQCEVEGLLDRGWGHGGDNIEFPGVGRQKGCAMAKSASDNYLIFKI
jgi:hypothetical protein